MVGGNCDPLNCDCGVALVIINKQRTGRLSPNMSLIFTNNVVSGCVGAPGDPGEEQSQEVVSFEGVLIVHGTRMEHCGNEPILGVLLPFLSGLSSALPGLLLPPTVSHASSQLTQKPHSHQTG